MLLGYLPDRAYYFTVQQTVDLGLLLWSPINFCPPSNVHLPCPVPVGATLPWQPSPPEIQLPAGRADGVAAVVGQTYLYAGGTDGKAAVPDVYFAKAVGDGNLDGWKAAPPLPEARSAAAAAVIGTTMYVIGGYGPDGKPTDTTYSITVANDGSLGDWATVDVAKLPVPLAGLSAAAVSDGIVVMGGDGRDRPVDERVEDAADQHRARHAPGVGGPEPAGGAERRRGRVPRRRLHLPRRREQRQRPGRDGPGGHARRPRHGAGEPEPDELAVEVQRPDEPARPAHEPLGLHLQRDDLHPGRLRRDEPAEPPRCGRSPTPAA